MYDINIIRTSPVPIWFSKQQISLLNSHISFFITTTSASDSCEEKLKKLLCFVLSIFGVSTDILSEGK